MAYGAPLDGLPEIQKPAPLQLFRIRHGDVHDANVVFDVSSCADRVFRGSMGDAKQLKRVLMREIGRGPSQSSAKLVVVDFGRAKPRGRPGRALVKGRCGHTGIGTPGGTPEHWGYTKNTWVYTPGV